MNEPRRLAFLGPRGTFGEEAAVRYDGTAQLIPFTSHAAIIAAVEGDSAEAGIVPVENSVEGAVNETLDVLIHDTALQIRDELVVPVEQCLIVRPGTRAEAIRTIASHPQGLGQCRRYIEQHFPGARLEATLSTAAAVEGLGQAAGMAAIATRRAAALYEAEVLAAGIQDRASNATRFVVVASADAEPTGDDKTSVAVGMAHDRPGTLVGVLNEFAREGINLTKIESRPSKDALGIYFFLIDFEGHRLQPTVAAVLARVRDRSTFFKLFGSYPRYRIPTPL